jgi:hypothetical protein
MMRLPRDAQSESLVLFRNSLLETFTFRFGTRGVVKAPVMVNDLPVAFHDKVVQPRHGYAPT